MKTKLITLLTLLILSSTIRSQDMADKFGEVMIEDFALDFEEDQESGAIVLFDCGESRFVKNDHGYDIRYIHTKRIKIRDKQKGEDYTEVEIPYYHDGFGKTEKIKKIEAYTYTVENGTINKKTLDKAQIFEDKINEKWSSVKFTFPNVQDGSIVEYRYEHHTPFKLNLPDWEFQSSIPTLYSEYVVGMVPFYEYVSIFQGIDKMDVYTAEEEKGLNRSFAGITYKDMVYTHVLKNVSAFKDESYIASREDYIKKLDFQLAKVTQIDGSYEEIMTTWEKLIKDLEVHENFGKYLKKSENLSKKIIEEELDLSGKSELEKIQVIVNYVKNTFTWNDYHGEYASSKLKDFLKTKSGNIGNINLFLTGLLRAANIEAYPLILSTRSNGKIWHNYPFSHFFNYVIVAVMIDEGIILTDGTQVNLPFNRIPTKCINGSGLIVDKENKGWLDLLSNVISEKKVNKSISIDPETQVIKTMATLELHEFDAYKLKNRALNNDNELKEWLKKKGHEEITYLKTRNYDKPIIPYIVVFGSESETPIIDDKLIIHPFSDFAFTENSLTEKERTYPVDFTYGRETTIKASINLPEGYHLVGDKREVATDNELGDFSLSIDQTKSQVIAQLSYTLKKAIYEPKDYQALKAFIDDIVKEVNNGIVLEKS